ncbi:hypothetical protein BCR39DRAFT_471711 [Naematelia encephala]|uniref:Uncharacterized protein n=1 Tax=Naematelia encephala TaxID=71784 RepID=A0A1Y2ARK1_9TREE|nr:hypothetical protein BCR39DRAFT_471711 [Naematelia encephala]
MPEPRMSHHHHAHYPSHAPPPYSTSHSYHHSSSRHVSNGPPPPGVVGGQPPGLSMGAPHPDAIGPAPVPMGNGHSHGPPVPSGVSEAARRGKEKMDGLLAQLATANENTWMLIGAVAEQMNDQDRALAAFENALRHNPTSILGLNAVASIARSRDNFDKAIEYFQRILNIKQDNGEVWGSMGHCLLMKDDLPKAYTAYQQALYHLPNPKEPKLWYGIGILYDRYGSFEHAEEAFSSVLKMDPNFEKANEIYFRLGIIYKHQRKYSASLDCFRYILNNPPRPLTSWDIWFQLGHVYEQDHDYEAARDAYMRVLSHQPDHAKVLQQLGWLHHQPGAPFADQDKAVQYLTKSLETDGSDAQSWYLLGRAFMAGQRYNKAYEAYQQAVYRDGRNPTFWCSIGVLYYQINQYRDALDAYSRAIRLNPYISEVWYNLGSLYESCNNQVTDAIDAYTRAADLDPTNATIKQRLALLQNAGANNAPLPPAPGPVDVHPSQYSATPQGPYPAGQSPGGSPRMAPQVAPVDAPQGARDLPPPPPGGEVNRNPSPGPFRGGGAPPPLQHVDESRGAMSRHAPLAPMETGPEPLRDGRDHYRGEPHRYDPAAEAPRRHVDSPNSPRRRDYAGFPPQPPTGYREREKAEYDRGWERDERYRQSASHGPSPRMHERVPSPAHAQQDPRRQPSPRVPHDYRGEYGQPFYPHDARSPYPPGPDPRGYDRKRERYEEPKQREPTPNGQAFRAASISSNDHRAPSPAPSASNRASAKRRNERVEDKSVKKSRDEIPEDGKKTASGNLKVTLPRQQVAEIANAPRRSSSPSRSKSSTPHQTPREAPPARVIDEDYDGNAADALMTLHGDRPSGSGSNGASPSTAGTKRVEPPSPNSPSRETAKKVRSEEASRANPSPARPSVERTRTVIEVLNAPRIDSPLPVPTPAVAAEAAKEAPAVTSFANPKVASSPASGVPTTPTSSSPPSPPSSPPSRLSPSSGSPLSTTSLTPSPLSESMTSSSKRIPPPSSLSDVITHLKQCKEFDTYESKPDLPMNEIVPRLRTLYQSARRVSPDDWARYMEWKLQGMKTFNQEEKQALRDNWRSHLKVMGDEVARLEGIWLAQGVSSLSKTLLPMRNILPPGQPNDMVSSPDKT